MTLTSILELRAATERASAAMPDLLERSRWLALLDALDRLAVLLDGIAWNDESSHQPELADGLRAASSEFLAALKVLRPSLGETLSTQCDDLARALDHALSRWIRVFRGHRPAGARRDAQSAVPGTGDSAASVPAPPASRVLFAASAPQAVAPEVPFVVRFVAYSEQDQERAQQLLRVGASGRTTETGAAALLTHGTVVQVAVSGKALLVEGQARCVRRLIWAGTPELLAFAVEPDAAFAGSVLCVDVMVDGIVLSRVRLELDLFGPQRVQAQQLTSGHAFAQRAFASYASVDRQRVLDRVGSIRLVAGVDVFLDCHDLVPGERWEPRLAREIDSCDAFLLFWSDAAACSEWVRWEWKRALSRPGIDRMQFHPLANGVKPPRELAAIHVNDPYVDLRVADRLRRCTAHPSGETHE